MPGVCDTFVTPVSISKGENRGTGAVPLKINEFNAFPSCLLRDLADLGKRNGRVESTQMV